MSKKQYETEFHPSFFDILDDATEYMTEEEFAMFYELFNHELSILAKNPFSNSRECQYGNLSNEGFRVMTFHSKLPRVNTGDMRIIFKVDENEKIIYYFAVGKRFNQRPRPENDIYSIAEQLLKDIK